MLRIVSFALDALLLIAATAYLINILLSPITLGSVYTGRLGFWAAIMYLSSLVLILSNLITLAIAFLKKRHDRKRLMTHFVGACVLWTVAVVIIEKYVDHVLYDGKPRGAAMRSTSHGAMPTLLVSSGTHTAGASTLQRNARTLEKSS